MIGDVHFGVAFFEGRRIFGRRVATLFPDFSPEKWGESLADLITYAMYGFVCGFKLLPMQFVLSIISATQPMLILQISLRPGEIGTGRLVDG